MAVISVANAKGGAGKTTVALLLALQLCHQGLRIVVLDADARGWMMRWAGPSIGEPGLPMVASVGTSTLVDCLRRFGPSCDHIIVDLSGATDGLMAIAFGLSDLVLVPVQGSAMDGWGASQAIELVRYVESNARTRIDHAIVLNRANPMVTTRAMHSVRTMLSGHGVAMIATPVVERALFRDMFEHRCSLDALQRRESASVCKALVNCQSFARDVLDRVVDRPDIRAIRVSGDGVPTRSEEPKPASRLDQIYAARCAPRRMGKDPVVHVAP